MSASIRTTWRPSPPPPGAYGGSVDVDPRGGVQRGRRAVVPDRRAQLDGPEDFDGQGGLGGFVARRPSRLRPDEEGDGPLRVRRGHVREEHSLAVVEGAVGP